MKWLVIYVPQRFQIFRKNILHFTSENTRHYFRPRHANDKWQTITSKKLTKENKMIRLVKPKIKRHQTLTSDIDAFGEVLQIIAEISNTTFQKS